jgi:peptidoglycan-associated lipoprotein
MKKKLLQGSIIPLILIIILAIGGCCAKKMAAPAPEPMPTTTVEPAPVVEEPAPAPEPEVMLILHPIYFDFDKFNLGPDAIEALNKNAETLKKNSGMKVRIEGNCDERGTSEYNMALGDRRAVSAMKYLGTLGIGADRMTAISYGKEKPSCTEHNEACWSKNRRDDFNVLK